MSLVAATQGTTLYTSKLNFYIAAAQYVAKMQYMPARLIARAKEVRDDGSVVEIVIWELPPCGHFYKYRLYFGAEGECRVRYDNERGKGDHRHVGAVEMFYRFESITRLLDDFQHDVQTWSQAS